MRGIILSRARNTIIFFHLIRGSDDDALRGSVWMKLIEPRTISRKTPPPPPLFVRNGRFSNLKICIIHDIPRITDKNNRTAGYPASTRADI